MAEPPNIPWDTSLCSASKLRWVEMFELMMTFDGYRWNRYVKPTGEQGEWDEEKGAYIFNFNDGSGECSCSLCYLVFPLKESNFHHACLVGGRAKMQPLSGESVPKTELTSALIGSRISKYIKENSKIKISKRFFALDSKCVLFQLMSRSCLFDKYTQPRLREIQ